MGVFDFNSSDDRGTCEALESLCLIDIQAGIYVYILDIYARVRDIHREHSREKTRGEEHTDSHEVRRRLNV